jgi:hypothetical protein
LAKRLSDPSIFEDVKRKGYAVSAGLYFDSGKFVGHLNVVPGVLPAG